MNTKSSSETEALQARIRELEEDNEQLRSGTEVFVTCNPTVNAPPAIKPFFDKASKTVKEYFKGFRADPSEALIEISGERYILLRASSLSYEFLKNMIRLYSDRGEEEAVKIGRNQLFDMAHLIGIEDARNFHKKMNLTDPVSKLSAGPIHFAYTGWAFVDILPESSPTPDDNFFLKYHHPFSFEADSWLKAKDRSNFPVCSMNAGYSSGWCEESFGIPLTSVEITCKARGDESCTFIMAPPHMINHHLEKESQHYQKPLKYDVPLFFERKKVEEKISQALREKEILLKEIHHRVKNNLQIISSLLNLQSENVYDENLLGLMTESRNRIHSMALIHEMLYATSDFSTVNFKKYATSLSQSLYRSYAQPDQTISFTFNIEDNASFDIDKMIPLGLILNEIISNSLKYAFPGKEGTVIVEFKNTEKGKILTVSDNGIGLPENFDRQKDANLGMQLIFLLADQLEIKAELLSGKKGTGYRLNF